MITEMDVDQTVNATVTLDAEVEGGFDAAFTTALVAPLIFAMIRRVDALPTRRREEGALVQ